MGARQQEAGTGRLVGWQAVGGRGMRRQGVADPALGRWACVEAVAGGRHGQVVVVLRVKLLHVSGWDGGGGPARVLAAPLRSMPRRRGLGQVSTAAKASAPCFCCLGCLMAVFAMAG